MGFLTVAILFISVAILAYNYPDMLRNVLPGWLSGEPSKEDHTAGLEKNQEKNENQHSEADLTESTEGDNTPKAAPAASASDVPSFTLSANDEEPNHEVNTTPEPPVPSFPAANSAQRVSAMPPPPKPAPRSSPGLMAPPARPIQAPMPSAASSLRIPTTGPLPNRGPPSNSQQRVSSSLSPNGAVKTPNSRGKVLLSPGHSPMDWAVLTRSGNLSGVDTFQRVTPSHLKKMTGRKGKPAWSSWQGKVYNITPYLPFHPGGEPELMKAAGRDGTKLFMDVHPWVNWENMLGACLVGVMVPEDHGSGGGSSLEDMD